MKQIILPVVIFFIILPGIAFSQTTEASLPTIDLCKDRNSFTVLSGAYHPQDGDESNVPEVYLSASSFIALTNATLVSLNNTCEVTGSDTSLIESDFNPKLHHSYKIVRWRPTDLPPRSACWL